MQTIEAHIVTLYSGGEIGLTDVMKLVTFSHLKQVKDVLTQKEIPTTSALKPIKEALIESNYEKVSYFEIKLALAMIEKKDL